MFLKIRFLLEKLLSAPVASNEEDDFEKWQKEVREAEAEALSNINDDNERPTTPPEGEEEFTDDDGTNYKWDRNLKAWVPQVGARKFTLHCSFAFGLLCMLILFLQKHWNKGYFIYAHFSHLPEALLFTSSWSGYFLLVRKP